MTTAARLRRAALGPTMGEKAPPPMPAMPGFGSRPYTFDQMCSYAAARDAQWQRIVSEAVAAETEACALLCDLQAKIAADSWEMTADPSEQGAEAAAEMLAAAIRARAKEQA